jgi:nitrate/TMAO reductase-like tetraheme cytochrome c subunit
MLMKIFSWCQQHLVLFTIFAVAFVVVFGFINVQILHMTSEPEFCHLCHPAQGVGPLAEVDSWEHSAHGAAGVSCLDCHGRPGAIGYVKAKISGLKDTYMQMTISREEKLDILSNPREDLVPDWHCLFCHSDEGNKQVRETTKGPMKLVHMRMLDDVVNPDFRESRGLPDIMTDRFVGGTNFDHEMHISAFDFTCRDCHFGVVHNPAGKTDRMNFCLACHAENKDTSAPQVNDCAGCHQAQLAMNEGKGAVGVEGEPGLMHAADIGCTDCHTGVTKGVYRPSANSCTDCHEGSEYNDLYREWAATTREKVTSLQAVRVELEAALNAADADGRNTGAAWQTYQRGLQNLRYVRNDGTSGVHNNDFALAILNSVEADFRQVMKQLDAVW